MLMELQLASELHLHSEFPVKGSYSHMESVDQDNRLIESLTSPDN
jgi:hypothetical protein